MRTIAAALALCATLAMVGCKRHAGTPAPAASGARAIDWSEGDVQDALARAKETSKPILLYWGAKWCPPCARLNSTVFTDAAFIAQTRAFIAVHLDGDSKGAQAWGERFAINGYPTVIILRPDGSEITRLSSGIEPAAFVEALRVSAGRTRSAADVLNQAQSDPHALSADEWRLLASFDWEDDPSHLADPARVAAILGQLAGAAPDPALGRRFALLGLANAIDASSGPKPTLAPAQQQQAAAVLPAILASDAEVRVNALELSYDGAPIIQALPGSPLRETLRNKLVAAGDRIFADNSLPIIDRLLAIKPAVEFATEAGGTPDASHDAVLATVRARVAWADGAAKSPIERQSVISDAAALLDKAGDTAGAQRLLQAELPRTATPFYYMSDLSDLAEKQHDNEAALRWARQAAQTAQGPASRVQWAALYAKAVLRLAPGDSAEIERSANEVVDELGHSPDAYHERTRRKVTEWAKSFQEWSGTHGGAPLLTRVAIRLQNVCAQQPEAPARTACASALRG